MTTCRRGFRTEAAAGEDRGEQMAVEEEAGVDVVTPPDRGPGAGVGPAGRVSV